MQTLLDDIINTVNELVFRAVNAIEEGLGNASPQALGFRLSAEQLENCRSDDARQDALEDMKQKEMDAGIVQLESLLNATVDKDFDKFEIYALRNILAVGHEEDAQLAKWVQLDHYKNLDLTLLANGDLATPEQVQLQRRKLQQTQKLNAMLKAEEAKNTAVLAQLHGLLGNSDNKEERASSFAFLAPAPHNNKSASSHTVAPNVQYAISQLPAVRELLAQLKSSLQTLPHARRRPEDDESTDVRRRQYLDLQSRRAMERKGIDVDAAAARTAAGVGRRIGKDEVQGVEAVVQALGGAQARRRDGDLDMDD